MAVCLVIVILFTLLLIKLCSAAEFVSYRPLSTAVRATMRVWPVLLCSISPVFARAAVSGDVWNMQCCLYFRTTVHWVPLLYIAAVHTVRN